MYAGLVIGGPRQGEMITCERPTFQTLERRPMTIWAIPDEAELQRNLFEEIEYVYLPLNEEVGVWALATWTTHKALEHLTYLAKRGAER